MKRTWTARLAWGVATAVVAGQLALTGPAWGQGLAGTMDTDVAIAAGLAKPTGTAKGRATPLAKDAAGRVIVYAEGSSAAAVRRSVEAAGGVVTDVDGNQARAAVPAKGLTGLAKDVRSLRRPDKPVPLEIVSEGAHLMGAPAWHSDGKQGAGVKVGILDVGFGRLEATQDNGELPADVVVNNGQCSPEAQSSHGTTVAEVVHDVAPAAKLYLACVTDSMDFDDAARWLREQGVTVVNVSLGFPGTGRGDGLVRPNEPVWNPATVVGWLRGENVTVVAAAGNEADKHWSGKTVDADGNSWVDVSGTAEAQSFSVPAQSTATLELKWDAWPLTNEDLDLYVMNQPAKPTGPNDPALVDSSINAQKGTPGGLAPTEVIELRNDDSVPHTYWAYVKSNGANSMLRYDLTGYGAATGFAFRSADGSIAEPASSPWALAVGAIQPANAGSGAVESYSGRGPTIDGRVKPDLVGYTGVSTFTGGVAGSTTRSGTSIAAAHVTGAAALYRAANPEVDASEVDALLINAASRSGRSNELGYGVAALGPARVPAAPAGSGFTPEQSPRRLLDAVTLAGGETRTIAVPGLANGATAVVLDVFGNASANNTSLQVFADSPTDYATLDIQPGRNNQVMTAVALHPVDKVVKIRNTSSTARVTVDLLGTFSADGASTYFPLQQPVKLMDTRTWSVPSPKLADAEVHRLPVRGVAGVPANATAVLVNVTGTDASAQAMVDLYAQTWPNKGTLTTMPGEQQTKLTVVPIGDDGAIRVRGRGGEQHVAIDLAGWFAPGAGAKYVPMRYTERAYDTKVGTNSVPVWLAAGQLREVRMTMQRGVPHDATAIWTSVQATAKNTPAPMSVAVSAREFPWQGHTSLSAQWYTQDTRSSGSVQMNDAVVPLGPTGVVGFRADQSVDGRPALRGTPDITVGLQGYFVGGAAVAPAAGPAPAAYWKLDEPSGTTGADASGNGHTLGFQGGSSWIGGRLGRAAWLDGTTAYGQTTGPVLRTDQSFSVAAWVYKASDKSASVVTQDGVNVSGFLLENIGGRWSFSGLSADATTNVTVFRAEDPKPNRKGEWSHLVGVYDATAHQLRLYVNGALAGVRDGVTLWRADGPLTVGAGMWNKNRAGYFDKGIDEVRAYQRAITESEVRELHAATTAVTWGQWEFDEGTGTVTQDATWRNWDGTLLEGAGWQAGKAGQGVKLNGTTSWVSLPARADLATDSFTVTAWVNPTAKDSRTVLAQDGSTTSPFHLQTASNDRWIFGAPGVRAAASASPPALNTWTHLAGVYDAAARQVRLYVNGVLTGVSDGVTIAPGTGAFTVGRAKSGGQPVNRFAGGIDKVELREGVMTGPQILALAQSAN